MFLYPQLDLGESYVSSLSALSEPRVCIFLSPEEIPHATNILRDDCCVSFTSKHFLWFSDWLVFQWLESPPVFSLTVFSSLSFEEFLFEFSHFVVAVHLFQIRYLQIMAPRLSMSVSGRLTVPIHYLFIYLLVTLVQEWLLLFKNSWGKWKEW